MTTLIMRWPITTPAPQLADLVHEARHDLYETALTHGLSFQGPIDWEIHHGNPAHLEATAPVTPTPGASRLPQFSDRDGFIDWHNQQHHTPKIQAA